MPRAQYFFGLVMAAIATVFASRGIVRAAEITQALPDLTPTALTAPASGVSVQQQIEVSWTVKNQGDEEAGPYLDVTLWFSADDVWDGNDTFLDFSWRVEALAAGGSYTETIRVTVPKVSAGDYYLIVWIDLYNYVNEANEANNERAAAITITTSDLRPTELIGPAYAAPGGQIEAWWTVKNQGAGEAVPLWFDNLYFSADDILDEGDALAGGQFSGVEPLAPGRSYSQSIIVTVPDLPVAPGY